MQSTQSGEALFHWPLSLNERKKAAETDDVAPLFDDASNFQLRHLKSLASVRRLTAELRRRNYRLVVTNGSFDLLHRGHSMYLERAREFGDFLLVGVDSDEKIFERKGRLPLVPEEERLEMLTFQRSVGAVFLKTRNHKRWTLLENARPDVFVVTAATYTESQIHKIKTTFQCEVRVLDRMATISSSARLRDAQMHGKDLFTETGVTPPGVS